MFILLKYISVVCINVITRLLLLFISDYFYIYFSVVCINADIGQLFFEKYLEKLI